ncbi:hypothetical protein HanXRQr2_Chr08g0341511 [Helianthus annuus]|uniref:Uncharacterized protein n=1 Tax=Helianthus annuus TaxID=4232 RepID=A0A9K3IFG6_HELAN|nr:hypothetical protein HanXRQr2_Chr08g0341511 [Helianthus annuus]
MAPFLFAALNWNFGNKKEKTGASTYRWVNSRFSKHSFSQKKKKKKKKKKKVIILMMIQRSSYQKDWMRWLDSNCRGCQHNTSY